MDLKRKNDGQSRGDRRLRTKTPRSGFFQRLRNNFLTGIVVVAPFAITIYLVLTIIEYVDASILPLIPEAYRPENLSLYLPYFGSVDVYLPGIGLLIFAAFLVFVGSFTKNFFGREILKLGERWVEHMPVVRSLYNGLKQIVETIFQQSSSSFDRACLIEYPRRGLWAVAFVSTEAKGEIPVKAADGREMMSVFLPTTPNPTSGFLLFVPTEDVVVLDMTVEEAAKLVISAGLVTPADPSPLDEIEDPAILSDAARVAIKEQVSLREASRRLRLKSKSPAGAGEDAARNPFNSI